MYHYVIYCLYLKRSGILWYLYADVLQLCSGCNNTVFPEPARSLTVK